MDAVDIVAVDDVHHHVLDELAVFGQTRVEINLVVGIFDKTPGLFMVDVSRGEFFVGGSGNAVGIEPGVEFHAAFMSLIDHELQRVPVRLGGFAALGEEAAPGFKLRGV